MTHKSRSARAAVSGSPWAACCTRVHRVVGKGDPGPPVELVWPVPSMGCGWILHLAAAAKQVSRSRRPHPRCGVPRYDGPAHRRDLVPSAADQTTALPTIDDIIHPGEPSCRPTTPKATSHHKSFAVLVLHVFWLLSRVLSVRYRVTPQTDRGGRPRDLGVADEQAFKRWLAGRTPRPAVSRIRR